MKKKIVKMIIMMSAVTMLAACTNNGGKSRGPYTEPDEVRETPDKPAKPTPADPEPAIDPEPEITGPVLLFGDYDTRSTCCMVPAVPSSYKNIPVWRT